MISKKKKNSIAYSEEDDIRKNARYDTIKMAIESYPKKGVVESKLKANRRNRRSHSYLFLWLKDMQEEGENINILRLEEDVLEVIESKYGHKSRDYREALKEAMGLTMTAAKMFTEGKMEEAIEFAYTKGKSISLTHATSIREMKKCMKSILRIED